jgi:hypothetical protein
MKMLLITCCLLLSACSAIPLSSMIQLSGIGAKQLGQIAPEQLRARITINDPAKLVLRDVRLVFQFEYLIGQQQEVEFLLTPLTQSMLMPSQSWFGAQVKRYQYEFKITPGSIKAFKQLQGQLLNQGKPRNFRWTVYYYLEQALPAGSAIDLDLAIKFSQQQDFLMILEAASIDIDQP